jgi:hypothetical protein
LVKFRIQRSLVLEDGGGILIGIVTVPASPDVFIARRVVKAEAEALVSRETKQGERDDSCIDQNCLGDDTLEVIVDDSGACGKEGVETHQEYNKCVEGSPEEKSDEVSDISVADASADPRAVMVVDLHAEAARAAVERPRRAQDFATVAKGHLIMPVRGGRLHGSILIPERWVVLKLL